MTQTEAGQHVPAVVGDKSRAFLLCGVFALLVTLIARPLGLFTWLPVVGGLFARDGAVGYIAILVVGISLWVLMFACVRNYSTDQERQACRELQQQVDRPGGRLAVRRLLWEAPANTIVAQRVAAFRAAADDATVGLAARSELDHALGEVAFMPARALVWALPALGFLGTAAEMSSAIGGLGGSVGFTASYADLRNALVSNVIPPLADAFGVTLFALGAAVLCHLVLTWTVAREQATLLDIEESTLKLIESTPSAGSGPAPSIKGELVELASELGQTRQQMAAWTRQLTTLDLSQLAHLGQLPVTMQSMEQRLSQIHAELSRDLVITRILKVPGEELPR